MSINEYRLVSERLIVRPFTQGDLNDLFEIIGDEETMRFLEPPYDLEKTRAFLNSFCIEKRGALAAEQRSDGRVIGYILFNQHAKDVFELGWVFNRGFWRRGFAFEASNAVLDNAFGKIKAKTVFSETADTVKAAALMRKLGMRFKRTVRSDSTDSPNETELYLYELTDSDWRSMRRRAVMQR